QHQAATASDRAESSDPGRGAGLAAVDADHRGNAGAGDQPTYRLRAREGREAPPCPRRRSWKPDPDRGSAQARRNDLQALTHPRAAESDQRRIRGGKSLNHGRFPRCGKTASLFFVRPKPRGRYEVSAAKANGRTSLRLQTRGHPAGKERSSDV